MKFFRRMPPPSARQRTDHEIELQAKLYRARRLIDELREQIVSMSESTSITQESLQSQISDLADTDAYRLHAIVRSLKTRRISSDRALVTAELETPDGRRFIFEAEHNDDQPVGRAASISIRPRPLADHDPRAEGLT